MFLPPRAIPEIEDWWEEEEEKLTAAAVNCCSWEKGPKCPESTVSLSERLMTDALMELWGELGGLKHEGTGKRGRFGFFPHEARASTCLGVAQKSARQKRSGALG